MADDTNFEERFDELRAQYVDRLEARVDEVEEMAAALRESFDPETFDELFQLVHRLAGSGETMGFPGVSEASIALEERLEEVDPAASEEWLDDVEAYCRRMREVLPDN